jgi:hypothetical protein
MRRLNITREQLRQELEESGDILDLSLRRTHSRSIKTGTQDIGADALSVSTSVALGERARHG